MASSSKIAVVGLWHLGEIYSVGLAELGHTVVGIDENEEVVQNLNQGVPPLAEPNLTELIASNTKAGRLSYASDFSRIRDCDTVWIAFDTPVDDNDEVQLDVIFDAVEKAVPHLTEGVLLVISSQIPIGTSEKIVSMIQEKRPGLAFSYAYSPENLRLGNAVECFLKPERVVVGADTEVAAEKMREILSPLKTQVVILSTASAEMTKHALNAFLATSISFTNDIADVCEQYGADVEEVIRALKSDPRVGQKAYLFAGLGFSGATLARDLKALMAAARKHSMPLPVIEGVFAKNKSRNAVVAERLLQELGALKGKKLALFGVTYKAGTSTLRRSQPLEIEQSLREAGAFVQLYDPSAKPEEVAAFTDSPFSQDPYEAAKGVDAILVMTPSRGFHELDFSKMRTVTAGALFFDTCNILWEKRGDIHSVGFKYICIGQ